MEKFSQHNPFHWFSLVLEWRSIANRKGLDQETMFTEMCESSRTTTGESCEHNKVLTGVLYPWCAGRKHNNDILGIILDAWTSRMSSDLVHSIACRSGVQSGGKWVQGTNRNTTATSEDRVNQSQEIDLCEKRPEPRVSARSLRGESGDNAVKAAPGPMSKEKLLT